MKNIIEFLRATRLACAALLLAVTFSLPASAASVASVGNVTVILTYPDYGGGDFGFRLSNQPSGCYGYWLSPSQGGFKTSVAFILKAHAAGDQILVGANTSQTWTGSAEAWCKVDYVGTPY